MYEYLSFRSASPSGITGLRVLEVNETSIAVQWEAPSDSGGRDDVVYTVKHKPVEGHTSLENTTSKETEHTFTLLKPATTYIIQVIVENGVSHLDPGSLSRRLSEVNATTQGQYSDCYTLHPGFTGHVN